MKSQFYLLKPSEESMFVIIEFQFLIDYFL